MARVAIVGAGPAGCLTARRLADAGHEVVLYEAGERLVPTLDFASLLDRTDLRWPSDQTPEAAPPASGAAVSMAGAALPAFGAAVSMAGAAERGVIRARAVGGASAINGMLLSAPDSTDLASWDAALGVSSGTARASLERVIADVSPQIATPGPLARLIGDAARAAGESVGGSTLDVDACGVLAVALAARSGERRDAPAVYLTDAPDTLRVQTGTTVTSLHDLMRKPQPGSGVALADSVAAVSAGADSAGGGSEARGSGGGSPDGSAGFGAAGFGAAGFDHVVVSAGALATPMLVAGVIAEIEQSPAQHHRAVALTVPLDEHHRVHRDQPAVTRVVRWCSGLDPHDSRADVQLVILDHMGWRPAGRSQGLVIVSLLSGSLLAGEETAIDRARLRAGVRRALELLSAAGFEAADFDIVDASRAAAASGHDPAFDAAGPGDTLPDGRVLDDGVVGDGVLGDGVLDAWIAGRPNPVHHVTSTLPLGFAVGRAGLVAGRSDLSVIDASVLPTSPRADTNMAVLALADLLATQLIDHLA